MCSRCVLCENLGVNSLCTVEVSCVPSLRAYRERERERERKKGRALVVYFLKKRVEFCENLYVRSSGTLSKTWPRIQCVLCESFGLNILRTIGVLSVSRLCAFGVLLV